MFRNRELRLRMTPITDGQTSADAPPSLDPEQINDLAKDFVQHTVKYITGGCLVVIAALVVRDTALEVVKAGFR